MYGRSDSRSWQRQLAGIASVGVLALLALLALRVGPSEGASSSVSDLALSKSDSPDPVFAGTPLVYSIQVLNLGPNAATNVVVTDSLPQGVSSVTAEPSQGSCGLNSQGRKVTCVLGTLPAGVGPQYSPTSAAITIRVLAPPKAPKKGTITNKASVSSKSKDPKRANNTAIATTQVVEPPKVTCRGREVTVLGTSGSDLLFGTPGNDVVFAGAGRDRIFTLGGKDLICAGGGRDVIRSGARRDNVLAGRGADRLVGGTGDDVLRGGPGPDLLLGGRGRDFLSGGLGRDRCRGGPGLDFFRGC